jgi:hypothetical protein
MPLLKLVDEQSAAREAVLCSGSQSTAICAFVNRTIINKMNVVAVNSIMLAVQFSIRQV